MITIKNYVKAESLEEAYQLNQKKQNRIVGGMLWLKMYKCSVNTAVDISGLGLDKIEETEDKISIGAMVTLRQIEQHEGLNSYTCGAVRKAVCDIVGVQFRNMATVGGSIWGRFGFSDVLTVFSSMDCCVELYKGGIVTIDEFINMKKNRDILVRIIVKKTPMKFTYRAVRAQRTDFPILTCAVSESEGVYKASIGARPMKAFIVHDENGILSGGLNDDSIKAFADYTASVVRTGSNLRGSSAYRTHLVKVLVKRNLSELKGEM